LSVEVGLGVLSELLEEEVEQIVGPKGRWNPDWTAARHNHEDGEVTLGGRRRGILGALVRRIRAGFSPVVGAHFRPGARSPPTILQARCPPRCAHLANRGASCAEPWRPAFVWRL
jgi:hypothetical protein